MSRLKSRFNLLLLEDGEYLLEEFTAMGYIWAPNSSKDDEPYKYVRSLVVYTTV